MVFNLLRDNTVRLGCINKNFRHFICKLLERFHNFKKKWEKKLKWFQMVKKLCVTHNYRGFDFSLENTCFCLPGIISFLLFIIIMFIFKNMFENRYLCNLFIFYSNIFPYSTLTVPNCSCCLLPLLEPYQPKCNTAAIYGQRLHTLHFLVLTESKRVSAFYWEGTN